jgi:hypothetical protein
MVVHPAFRKLQLERVFARRQPDVGQCDAAAAPVQQHGQAQQQRHGRRALVPGRRQFVFLFDRGLAPVAAHHDREQLLFVARETAHVGVRQ